jgi:hypothetical protein
MKAYRTSFLSVAAFLMLLCSISIVSRTATACPWSLYGSGSFTALPGGSQIQTWTAIAPGSGWGIPGVAITAGSDVFSISQYHMSSSGPNDTVTFTITFTPGANSTGTFTGTMTNSECHDTYGLVGTVAASGVENSLPSNVSFTITPNPATDNINIMSSGVRTAEIGIYDLLGKEIASSKTTTWKWDASSIATGSYIVRIVGESNSGEQFAIWRRIIIAR